MRIRTSFLLVSCLLGIVSFVLVGCQPADLAEDSDGSSDGSSDDGLHNVVARGPDVADILKAAEADAAAMEPVRKEQAAAPADNKKWGHLSGRFVFQGEPPVPGLIDTSGDAYCTDRGLVDESLLVDQDSHGIANVVIGIYLGKGEDPPESHPDYARTANETPVLTIKGCRFEPHILLMRSGQPWIFRNEDPIGHNPRVLLFANGEHACDSLPTEAEIRYDGLLAERVPGKMECSIHPWMSAYLVINDHPYTAVSKKDGSFIIPNLPVGKHKFRVWHEHTGYVSDSKLQEQQVSWTRGYEIEIKPGENNLGKIIVSASAFEE